MRSLPLGWIPSVLPAASFSPKPQKQSKPSKQASSVSEQLDNDPHTLCQLRDRNSEDCPALHQVLDAVLRAGVPAAALGLGRAQPANM